MVLISTNFIGGRMNKTVDERLLPVGEYIDAMNIRLGSTEATEMGAVENSLGNTILTNVQFLNNPLSSSATTIGVYEDGINETIYWFVNDENNLSSPTGKVDMILSFNTTTGSIIYHVISTEVLNFDKKYLITGVNKIDDLLFFTDNLNPPRVINVVKDPAYPIPVGGYDTILEEEDLSVILKPPGYEDFDTSLGQVSPLGAPYVEPKMIVGQENYMETRFLSFAYRYRYSDGGYSAISLFTTPVFQPKAFRFSIQNYLNAGMFNRYNGCDVWFSTGSKRVVEVDLLYKQTTSNVIYVVKRYNKVVEGWSDNSFVNREFANSEIYTTLGSDELLRLYDNVPKTAKAQTIQGNRLIYGNYKDGYDLTATEGGSKIIINYSADPVSEQIAGVSLGNGGIAGAGPANPATSSNAYTNIGSGSNTGVNSMCTWDLSEANPIAPAVISAGTTFNFSYSVEQSGYECVGSACPSTPFSQQSPFNIIFTFICPQDYNNIADMCSSQEFENKIGGSISQGFAPPHLVQELYPCNNSDNGATLSDKLYGDAVTPMTGTDLVLINGGRNECVYTGPFPLACSTGVVAGGVTDGSVIGSLTDTTADFVTLGVAVGDIVMDMTSGLTAVVDVVTSATELQISDNPLSLPGATATLDQGSTTVPCTDCATYSITPPGGATAPCLPEGFEFLPNATGFSISLPATQYYYDDGSGGITNAYLYYSFISYGCTAGYLKVSNTGSLHSNRDYETAIVYMDGEGRSSTALVSNSNTSYFEPNTSVFKNKVRVTLEHLPPYWAKKYKFVMKPSEGTYQTIFANVFYQQDGTGTESMENDPSLVWFKLEGNNQNLLKVGDELIVKVDTSGAVLEEQKTTVLAITAFSTHGITKTALKGLYMLLKPSGWTIEGEEQNYFYPQKNKKAKNGSSDCGGCINDFSLNDPATNLPYDIPAGSTITIKISNWRGGGGGNCDNKKMKYTKSFISTSDYPNFHAWSVGDDLQAQMNTGAASSVDEMDISYLPGLSTSSGCPNCQLFHTKCYVRQASNLKHYFVNTCAIPGCGEWFEGYPGHCATKIEVTRGGSLFVWETTPQDADANLFYDASELLDIQPLVPGGQSYHMASRVFSPVDLTTGLPSYSIATDDIDQDAGISLETTLNAYNCYTFGNGVESFRINDSPAGKTFNLGERTLAVSNQDFKEANRFAGLSYSGVFSGAANSNNLNEFNLGLVNYKDLESSFGPVQKLYSRETDVLVLQEDRISYVLVSKNVITDSTGGGAIASVPQVLGTQIARIEEYGISFNPESFVSWGSDMFFTDAKRGVVLNLRGASQQSDQLSVISQYGMNTWFRDLFNNQLTTQKLGGYDPYMNEYVLSSNGNPLPIPPPLLGCNSTVNQFQSSQIINYDVSLGLVIGQVDIPYIVTSGSISISVVWNGLTYTSGTVSGNGTFSFNKTLNTPNTCSVTITPSSVSDYNVTVQCPPEVPLNVVQVVVNSPNYTGDSIHTNYNWQNTSYISPYSSTFSPVQLIGSQPAGYSMTTGVRSIGLFPHDGADIKLRTQKIAPDNFNFDPAIHKFRILSSNTLYTNSPSDITNLLIAAPAVSSGVIQSPANTFSATESAFNMPIGNEYLYLIWDLRVINSQQLCYCDSISTAQEVCCDCSLPCYPGVWLGPTVTNGALVCATDTSDPGALGQVSFNGSGGVPVSGDVVYDNVLCNDSNFVPIGFYVISNFPPTPFTSPNWWVQIGANGVVLDSGPC